MYPCVCCVCHCTLIPIRYAEKLSIVGTNALTYEIILCGHCEEDEVVRGIVRSVNWRIRWVQRFVFCGFLLDCMQGYVGLYHVVYRIIMRDFTLAASVAAFYLAVFLILFCILTFMSDVITQLREESLLEARMSLLRMHVVG